MSPTPAPVSTTAGQVSLLPPLDRQEAGALADELVSHTRGSSKQQPGCAGKTQDSRVFHSASAGPELGWILWGAWRRVSLNKGLPSLPLCASPTPTGPGLATQ